MTLKRILILLFVYGLLYVTDAQPLFINEVMPSNISALMDEDGDYSDWIELYNSGATPVQLHNYGITDHPTDPFRWTFPDISVAPHGYLLLFASGKNKSAVVIHLETVIDWGDQWKYFVGDSAPPPDWNSPGFNPAAWPAGPSGFGYGDGDDSTDVGPQNPFDPGPVSVFIRKKFTVSDVNEIVGLLLHVDYDDAFVAYLNGHEIARANIGVPGVPPAYDQFADSDHEAKIYRGLLPDEFQITNYQNYLQTGDNVLALEVHNVQLYSSDLTLIPFLTFEMNTIPPNPDGPSPVLQLSLPNLHTNFRINATGETLLLTDASGSPVDSVETGYVPGDISFGRQPDGAGNWYYFDQSTPGSSNTTPGYLEFSDPPQFSLPGGFYNAPVSIQLSSNVPDTDIYYTLNGSLPTDSAHLYIAPVQLDSTIVVRARAFENGRLPSQTITHTYFIDQNFTLPVISLATDSLNLFDWNTGIYVMGPDANPEYPHFGANFWEDWERPIHIEFYEPDGSLGFGIDAGTKIFGSWSRLYPQKSLSVYARDRYGDSEINHQIFPDKPITEFQAIVLRNSGQDWGKTFFRDAMMQSLVEETDIDIQAYRPAMVFINGKNWGIHNVREKMNEHYLASNRGVDPDNIDLIERDTIVVHGDASHYNALLQFVQNHDLSDSANFEYVKTQMDVSNFMDYTIACLYFANPDWPWNNVKCWRPRTPGGRWKWMLFDTDYGFHAGHLTANANTFNELASQQTGVTTLFFKLLENPQYKNRFINRYADHLNTTFDTTRVLNRIEQMKTGIEPDMPYHIDRWKYTFNGPWWLGKSIDSMTEWYGNIQVAVDFGRDRTGYVRQHILQEFNLYDGGIGTLNLSVSPAASGRIHLNSLMVDSFPWSGKYFPSVPVSLTAIPKPGYRFSGWSGAGPQTDQSITIQFTDGQTVTALFELDTLTTSPVVINEINYNSAPNWDTEDWVEFYNASDSALDLTGWQVKDDDDTHIFEFPAGTVLPADSYVVACRDTSDFTLYFPEVSNYVGDLGFGFTSAGELVRLYDAQGNLVDSLTFGVSAPWPPEPNGNGPTLSLKNPYLDNTLPQSWAPSQNYGTPGRLNDVFVSIDGPLENIPHKFILHQNYPNPFNSQTRIQFSLPAAGRVRLTIYNVLGQKVITLIDRKLTAGPHKIYWDGRNAAGVEVSSGFYFYYLKTSQHQAVKKMLYLR